MQQSYQWVLETIERGNTIIYGINTGFGSLAQVPIALEQTRQLARNLILTCLVGVGEPLPLEIVRAMMLVRANIFARARRASCAFSRKTA